MYDERGVAPAPQDLEQDERVAGQEMLRYQADKALFDQLHVKYLQLHASIESSGARPAHRGYGPRVSGGV